MIKFVYFDFGGIFVNYDKALQGICGKFNLNFDEFIEFYDGFADDLNCGRISTDDFIKKTKEKFKIESLGNFDFYKSWVMDYVVIQPMFEVAKDLENMLDLGIISNISTGLWEASVNFGKAPDLNYKKVFLSCNLGFKKPDPRIYELAEKESGVKPEEILFIDDQEKNLIHPKERGWKVFQFDQYKAEEGIEEITKILEM